MLALTLLLRMLTDVEHFQAKLGKIAGAGDLGDKLFEIAQGKSVAASTTDEAKPEPPAEEQEQEKGTDSPES